MQEHAGQQQVGILGCGWDACCPWLGEYSEMLLHNLPPKFRPYSMDLPATPSIPGPGLLTTLSKELTRLYQRHTKTPCIYFI